MEIKESPEEKVLSFLEKFDGSTPEIIANGTGIFKLNVYKILKKLSAANKVVPNETEPDKYSISKKAETTQSRVNKASDEVALPTSFLIKILIIRTLAIIL